jgi:hypothetical protein
MSHANGCTRLPSTSGDFSLRSAAKADRYLNERNQMSQENNSQEEKATQVQVEDQRPKAPGWIIENIERASINARKIYFSNMGFLVQSADLR